MENLWSRIAVMWCRTFHPEPSWPFRGHYHCPACSRTYPVPWHEGVEFAIREGSDAIASGRVPRFGVFELQASELKTIHNSESL
jgi:hypothetical protein